MPIALKKTVFMLPGQGSQFHTMGRQAYEQNHTFRRVLDDLSKLALPTLGISIVELLYGPASKPSPFSRSWLMHPTLFAFHYAWAKAFEADGIRPDLWLGYSLGEITSCALAGAISREDALCIAAEIGRLAEIHTPPAGMMAVLAPAEMIQREPGLFAASTLACRNYAQHFVVTADLPTLRRLQTALRSREILAEILPIDRGFHSDFLYPIRHDLTGLSSRVRFSPFLKPVLSCCLRRILTLEDLRGDFFWQVHRLPVQFHETLAGLDSSGPCQYIDLSATGTLAAFARRIIPEPARVTATLNPLGPGRKNFQRVEIPS